MAETGTAVTGPLPVADAWERYTDPERWAQWAPQIRAVETDASRIAEGVTGRVLGWAGTSVDFVVTTWDEQAHRWSWRVTPRLALPSLTLPEVRLGHGLRVVDAGTQAWLTARGPAYLVFGYLLPARFALYRLVH
jgi:hypothetical protein